MKDTSITDSEAVREKIRTGYSQIAQEGSSRRNSTSNSCCSSTPITPEKVAQQVGYSPAQLAVLPEGANMGLSCGNPTRCIKKSSPICPWAQSHRITSRASKLRPSSQSQAP